MTIKLMPNRDVHNKIAYDLMKKHSSKKLYDLINDVNKEMDAPSQWLGGSHRVLYHSKNATRLDSLIINKGNVNREIARRIHLILDYDKDLQKLIKIQEALKGR